MTENGAATPPPLSRLLRAEIERPMAEAIGGWRRLQVIVLLACVLALDGADKTTVGAVAAQLEAALHIGNTQVGLLVTASTAVGAIATLPVGVLVDRIHRKRLLSTAVVIWSAAMILSGFAGSYLMLLVTRLALGAVVATAAPAVASLTGDLFPSFERGRIWGYLLAGELLGSAFGFVVSGSIAGLATWRGAFWLMGLLGMALAWMLARHLVEPARGGHARLSPYHKGTHSCSQCGRGGGQEERKGEIKKEVEEADIQPHTGNILHHNPARLSFWRAVTHVLSVRTNVILIVASALGYFYFTGLRTFAVVFMSGRFGLAESTASLLTVGIGVGSIIGVFATGRLADYLITRGRIPARVTVGASAFLLTAVFLLPGLLSTSLFITAPLFFLAALALGGTNPPLDAARLDVMHSRLWGRAESIRTTLRYAFEAVAPLVFGYISTLFGGHSNAMGRASEQVQQGAAGLEQAFLIMLVMLVIAGLVLFAARRTYPRDTATALASEHATQSNDDND